MILYLANDLIEIPSMDYFQEHDKIFKLFFYLQIISDIFLLLGIIEGLYSTCGNKYIPSIVAYYSLVICFIFHSAFCIYTIFQLKQFEIIKGEFFTIMLWLIYDYIMFYFSWFLFCNMIIIRRERRKVSQKKTEFSFNFN